ncbi:MAG: tetratricopeptide repeat protein [Fidelibacterota bacterium]
MRDSSADSPIVSPTSRQWLFRGFLILIPFLLIGLIESTLRLINYGDDLQLFRPDPYVEGYLTINLQVGKRYFSTGEAGSFGTQSILRKTKQPNTLRIFALGGSTTAGYPYMYLGTFPEMLKDRLAYSYPDIKIEMVNLGMTAVTSFTVLDFGKELLKYEPDLIVIYTGHNEFYGALGSGSNLGTGGSRVLTLLYLKLNHWRLFQLFRNTLRNIIKMFNGESETPAGTLMERMVKDQAIPYHSNQYLETMKVFQANLQDLINVTSEQGIPVVIGTLVANLRSQNPFVSIPKHSSNEIPIKENLIQAKKFILKKDYQKALSILEKAMSLDSTYALTHFYSAVCHDRLGNYPSALKYYTSALNLDGLRFRAGTDANNIIRNLARNDNVYLADIETAFAEASPGGIIGSELMLEHLHPNLDGYSLIAKTFAEVIIESGLVDSKIKPRLIQTDEWFQNHAGVTSLDLKMAEYRIAVLKSGWPFNLKGRTLYPQDIKTKSFLEEQAKAVITSESNYEKAHVALAEYYRNEGKVDSAVIEYKALAKAFPINESPYAQLGRLLVQTNQFSEALPYLLRTTELVADQYSHKWAGAILVNNGQVEEGIPHLKKALELKPEDNQVRFNLSGAYFLTRDTTRALSELEILLQKQPNFPDARRFYSDLKKAYKKKE